MKLQINVSDDMCNRVDTYAKQLGVSRSALCALFIGQGVMGFDKGIEIAKETINREEELAKK